MDDNEDVKVTESDKVEDVKKDSQKKTLPSVILFLTMLCILYQAIQMQRSVDSQTQFNSSGLRPYLGVDPSFKTPYVEDTLIIVTSSVSNFGRTPAYNTILIGRPTTSNSYPDSLLRRLLDEDLDKKGSILFPGQPGITFNGESTLRDGITGQPLWGTSFDSLYTDNRPLYYHVYCEYESAWDDNYSLRCSFEYQGGTVWSTLFSSEEPI